MFSSTINNQRSFFLLFWLTRENQFHKIIYWISDWLCNLFKWMYKLNMYKKYSHIFCVDMQCSVYCYTSQVSFSSCTSIFNKFWFWMCFFFTGLPSKTDSFARLPICCHQGQGFCCHSWGCQEQLWSFAQQLSIKVHKPVQSRNQTFIVYYFKINDFFSGHNFAQDTNTN